MSGVNPFGDRDRRNINLGSVTTRQGDARLGIIVRFERPDFGEVFPVTNASVLRSLFRRLQGATIKIQQYDEDGDEVFESGDITVSSYNKFKERFFVGESDGEWIPEVTDYKGFTKIIVARRVATPEGGFTQQFREGVTNCLLLPISAWVDTLNVEKTKKAARNKIAKFQKKYPYGVPQNALDDICIALNINIDILAPFSKRVIRKGRTNKKEPRKSFYLDNTYQNHVSVAEEEKVIVDNMEDWKLEKNDMYWDSPSKDKKRSIYKVRRGDTIYTTKPPDEEIEFYNKMKDTGFCYTKHPKLKEFIQSSIHYTGCMNFVFEADEIIEARDCRHIDQKKSYASYRKSKWYQGFLTRPSFFAQTDKIQGIGIYLITDIEYTPEIKQLNDKLGFLANDNAYPSPFLKWLLDKGVTFTVVGGCWGVRMDFDFPECMLDEGAYSIWAGCCDTSNPDKAANIYGADPRWLASVEENVTTYDDNNCKILIPKDKTIYKGHITSFLVGYSYISTLEQLLQFDNLDGIIRVIGDGIYFRGELPELVGSFRTKEDPDDYKKGGGDCEGFFARLSRCKGNENYGHHYTGNTTYFGFAEYVTYPEYLQRSWGCNLDGVEHITHDLQNPNLWDGGGGFGKSYTAVNAKWIIDPVFLFPSHDLKQDFVDNYPELRTMTHARLLHDAIDQATQEPKWKSFVKGCSVAVVDEGSMLNQEQTKEMFDRLKSVGIFMIMLADLKYQIPPIEGQECKPKHFKSVIKFETDYRSINEKTKQKKQQVRDLMDKGKHLNYIMETVIDGWGNTDKYQKEDMIICSRHEYCHEHTKKFAAVEKYRVIECFQNYNTGQILFEKPTKRINGRADAEGLNCGCMKEIMDDKKYELRHGYTIHSVQGKTTENRLFIDTRKMRCSRMFYTAISRCRDWDTIVFLK